MTLINYFFDNAAAEASGFVVEYRVLPFGHRPLRLRKFDERPAVFKRNLDPLLGLAVAEFRTAFKA